MNSTLHIFALVAIIAVIALPALIARYTRPTEYVVTCLDDDGERVRARSLPFDSRADAHAYAGTVCPTRKPRVHSRGTLSHGGIY